MIDHPDAAAHTLTPQAFEELVHGVREELHRYCARMTGSVSDGEDVVQETLARAFAELTTVGAVPNVRAWLFRIAHNKCIDLVRRHERRFGAPLDEVPDPIPVTAALDAKEVAEFALSWYVKLTALQRSCVILMDVMDYSMVEISELLDVSVPAIKGALHRGRTALRSHATQAQDSSPAVLDAGERLRLERYAAHFNDRDFDALRDLLASDARLELVGRHSVEGARTVGNYYTNYEKLTGWRVAVGTVDGRLALLGYHDGTRLESSPASRPDFFVMLQWRGDRIAAIRDFRYAPWAVAPVRMVTLDESSATW